MNNGCAVSATGESPPIPFSSKLQWWFDKFNLDLIVIACGAMVLGLTIIAFTSTELLYQVFPYSESVCVWLSSCGLIIAVFKNDLL